MEEVNVQLSGQWPDYVFSPSYDLKPLSEVSQFIQENNRLPEVPSAKEVEENGLNLGEMDAKLLQKIEELTLYLIEQNKNLKQLQEENNILKEQYKVIERLQERVSKLEAKNEGSESD